MLIHPDEILDFSKPADNKSGTATLPHVEISDQANRSPHQDSERAPKDPKGIETDSDSVIRRRLYASENMKKLFLSESEKTAIDNVVKEMRNGNNERIKELLQPYTGSKFDMQRIVSAILLHTIHDRFHVGYVNDYAGTGEARFSFIKPCNPELVIPVRDRK